MELYDDPELSPPAATALCPAQDKISSSTSVATSGAHSLAQSSMVVAAQCASKNPSHTRQEIKAMVTKRPLSLIDMAYDDPADFCLMRSYQTWECDEKFVTNPNFQPRAYLPPF